MKEKKFTMPTSFTTLLILTALVAVMTFIIPAGQYEYVDGAPIAGTYQVVEQNTQGLWDIVKAPIEGFKGAIDVVLFVLVLGGCLGVLFETKAIDAALSKVVKRLEGREKIMIPIIMCICAIGGTTYGMAEETIAFYPIIFPILLAAGYDVVTGVMVVFLGAGAGIAGGIINPFSVGIGSNLVGISLGDGILCRVIMILGIIPWGSKFNIHIFETFHNFLLGVPVLGTIIGNSTPLGDWYFTEMTMLFLVGAILIGKIYQYNEKQIVNLFVFGAKDILSVALVLGVAKGLSVVMTNGLIIDTILHFGEQLLAPLEATLFPAISYLLYIPMSFLIPSSSGLQTATIPTLAPLSDFMGIGREFVVMACQAGAETMNYISPTQAVLIGALTLAKIPYECWLRHILPYFFGTIIITGVVLTLGSIFL